MTDTIEEIAEERPLRVMGVFAHPDDPEFFAGATFAKWSKAGAEIVFVVATSGDKGSSDPEMTHERLVEIREEEERKAAAVLGVKEVVFLRHKDGELFPNLELRRDVTRQIRKHKPDIVVTLDPTVFWRGTGGINHPDHRAIGAATFEAVFPAARDRLNFFELERDEKLETHKVLTVYVAGAAEPTLVMDVTDSIDMKILSLHEHKSQISDMDALAERLKERMLDPESPPEFPRYVERFRMIKLRG